jgi:hypothetical protein
VTIREEALRAVNARLERVAATGDLAPVIGPDAINDARRLAGFLEDDDSDLPARLALGFLHWYRHKALPEEFGRQDRATAIMQFARCFIDGAAALPPALLPVLAERGVPDATSRLRQLPASAEPALILPVARLWQRIATVTGASYPGPARRLSQLADMLLSHYEATRSMAQLDAAVNG